MLFVLDSSLSTYAFQNVPPEVVTGLDTLAMGFREGKHIVAGPLPTLNALLRIGNLEPKTKAALRFARDRFPELMALPAQFGCYAVVVPHSAGGIRKTSNGGRQVVEIPIGHFSDSSRIQKTVVLGENINDADLAVLMAEFFRSQKRAFRSIPIRHESRGGGGGNLGDEYQRLHDGRERFTVIIVDSDKASPGSALGSTARAVLRVHADNGGPAMMEIVVLDCHEMENALPDVFYEEAFLSDHDHRESVELLRRLSQNSELEMRKFIDIKSGISLGQIFSMPANSPAKDFWSTKLTVLRAHSPLAAQHHADCASSDSCTHPDACQCWFLRPNGNDILGRALELIPRFNAQQRNSFGPQCSQTWNTVGKVVFEWCSGWGFSAA